MKRFVRATCVLAAIALAASCSSGNKSTGGTVATTAAAPSTSAAPTTAPTSGSAATTASAAVTPAAGEPIRVGFVNIQGGATVSLPDYSVGANAAVEYANKELGGIAGRPIQLVTCYTNATPESSIACGNQMVDNKVVLVTLGTDANPAQLSQIVVGAGIPYVSNTGNSTTELTDKSAFAWTAGAPSGLAAYATYASKQGYKNFAVLVIDNPAATGAVETLGKPVFAKAGVSLKVITVAPGTPDMTPQLQAAIDGGAQMLGVLGDSNMCTAFYNAYQTLNASIPAAVFNACLGTTILAGAPANLLKHLYVPQKLRLDDDGTEGQLFRRVLKTYAPNADATSPIVAAGYATVLGIARMLTGVKGEVTAETVKAQLSSATADYPIAPGSKLKCDSKAIPSLPRVCSSSEFWYQIMPDRTLEYVDTFNVAPLFAA